jgi:flavoprotein
MQVLDATNAAAFARQTNAYVLIVPTDFYKSSLASIATNAVTVEVRGFNTVKGARANLTAVIHR